MTGVGGRFFGTGGGGNSALDAFAASIELGGAANFSLTGDSFLIAEEVSTLLPSSMHPGGGAFDPTSAGAGGNGNVRFALSGREIERALSGSAGAPFDHTFADDGDVETLRDASALPDRLPPASGLFGDDGAGAGAGGNQSMATKMFTEGMEPPPYYDDDDDNDNGGGFGGADDDDDGEGDGYGGLTPSGLPPTPLDGNGNGGDGSPALVGTAALLAAANGGRPLRRKRPRLDVSAETGAPRTQLVNIDIRRLLQDPSPLMRVVEAASAAAGFGSSVEEFGAALTDLLVSNAAAARARKERSDRGRALLARPTFAPFMAPELYDAVVRCAPPPVAAAPRKPRNAAAAAAAGEEGDLAGPSAAFGAYNDDDGGGGAWAGANDDDEDDYVGGGFGGIENENDGGEDGDEERVGGAAEGAAAGPSSSSAHSAAITRRTRAALERFQGEWGSDAAARGDPAAARPASLDAIVASAGAGGGRATRLDAARWFFEVLVLRSRGFVEVSQAESYGDVEVRPRAMAYDEGVLGALGGGGNGNGGAPAPPAGVVAVRG